MQTVQDFVKHIGSQKKVAELMCVSEATISRAVKRGFFSPAHAEIAERISGGLYDKRHLVFPAAQYDCSPAIDAS